MSAGSGATNGTWGWGGDTRADTGPGWREPAGTGDRGGVPSDVGAFGRGDSLDSAATGAGGAVTGVVTGATTGEDEAGGGA